MLPTMSGREALELGENHVEHPDFKDWMATAVVDLPNGGFLYALTFWKTDALVFVIISSP